MNAHGQRGHTGRTGYLRRGSRWLGPSIIGLTVGAAYFMGTRLWFFSDEWNIIASYHRGRVLEPFNSHLSAVPIGMYQALFHSVGLDSYVPYRMLGLTMYALLGWMTWRYARTRLGSAVAALVTAALLWNSSGVSNVMFPFLLNFSLPVACLAAIWWHCDRNSPAHEVAASCWLVLALATSGIGLMAAAAVGAELMLQRAPLRRWAVMSVGPILWLAWYMQYGVSTPATGGIASVARYAGRMLFSGTASLVGGNGIAGSALCVAILCMLVRAAVRGEFTPRVAGALIAPVSFAVITAISRVGATPSVPPEELRYQWTVAAFVVLMIVNLLPTRASELQTSPEHTRTLTGPSEWAARATFAVALLAVLVNGIQLLRDIRHWESDISRRVRGVRDNLWVVDFAAERDVVDRGRIIPVSYVPVRTGDYLDGIEDIGNPLEGEPRELFGGFEDARDLADEAFVAQAAPLFASTVVADCREPIVLTAQSFPIPPGSRVSISATDPSEPNSIVQVRLFGQHGPGPAIGTATASGPLTVQFPALGSDAPVGTYWVTTTAPTETVVCAP